MIQKFKKGDHVKIAKDLGKTYFHFQSNCEAIIIGSYADQYGGDDITSYTLHIKNDGKCSWYKEHQLILIQSNRLDLLKQWEEEEQTEISLKSNIDWIFENGKDVIKSPHGASVKTLASCFTSKNLWGNNGEGFIYQQNSLYTLFLADYFLKNNDKQGWLNFCENIKEDMK